MKCLKALIIITVFTLPLCAALTSPDIQSSVEKTANFYQDNRSLNLEVKPPVFGLGETVGIIVDPALWPTYPSLQTAVNQYKTDLENTGYTVLLKTDVIGGTPLSIRTFLQNWYRTYSITGVALIGNLPYAQFYHPANVPAGFPSAETFICDLYYMDLDGDWYDTGSPPGVFNVHNATASADIDPEIYVARIDATSRTLGGQSNVHNIITVLNRTHSYRTGGVSRTHRAITYYDDDWENWADGTYDNWPSWLNSPYPVRTDVYTNATTTAADWLTRLGQDYEWAHLCAHSGVAPSQHYFGPGGSGEGTVTATQIHNTVPKINFYNLYCCHGADFQGADCLATTYLFSGSHTIATIGSTKTGGMWGGSPFYNSLGQDKTIGKAFVDWLPQAFTYTSLYVEWFYGMVILGDPFATTVYDCTVLDPTVSSNTHPNQLTWYPNNNPILNWTTPKDVNPIIGYYYIIDQNPLTVPTGATGTYTAANSLVVPTLTDGTWFFHIVAVDLAGNIGSTGAHYQLNVDSTAPTISISTPANNSDIPAGNFIINWNANDIGSMPDYVEIYLDGSGTATAVVYSPVSQYTLSITSAGKHTIELKVYDSAGNSNSDSITINIVQSTNASPVPAITAGGLVLITIIMIARKRKQK